MKLKFQHSGHLIQRANLLEKTLMLGKIDNKRRRGQQRVKWLDSITDSMDMNLRKLWERVEDEEDWSAAVFGLTELGTTYQMNNNCHEGCPRPVT